MIKQDDNMDIAKDEEIEEVTQTTQTNEKKAEPVYQWISDNREKFLPFFKGNVNAFERMARTYVAEVYKCNLVGECTSKSITTGFTKCCEYDLEPGTGKVYLLKYYNNQLKKNELSVQVGYQGYLDLLWRSPLVENVYSNVVYKGDLFELRYGNEVYYSHTPKYESTELRLTYAVVNFKNGHIQIRVASKDEIDESKSVSKGSSSASSPWNKYYDAMAQVVPMRKLCKNLALAIRIDDEFINPEVETKEAPLPNIMEE